MCYLYIYIYRDPWHELFMILSVFPPLLNPDIPAIHKEYKETMEETIDETI